MLAAVWSGRASPKTTHSPPPRLWFCRNWHLSYCFSHRSSNWPRTHEVPHIGFEPELVLPQPSGCWHFRYELPCLALRLARLTFGVTCEFTYGTGYSWFKTSKSHFLILTGPSDEPLKGAGFICNVGRAWSLFCGERRFQGTWCALVLWQDHCSLCACCWSLEEFYFLFLTF